MKDSAMGEMKFKDQKAADKKSGEVKRRCLDLCNAVREVLSRLGEADLLIEFDLDSLPGALDLAKGFLANLDSHKITRGFIKHTQKDWETIRKSDSEFIKEFLKKPLPGIPFEFDLAPVIDEDLVDEDEYEELWTIVSDLVSKASAYLEC